MTRVCSKCGVEKPATLEFFDMKSAAKSGLTSSCKICKSSYMKEYNKTNSQKVKDAHKKWKKDNPEKAKVIRQRRRHRKRSLLHTLTAEQWQYILSYFDNSCAYCGSKENLTQEHFIPLAKNGHYTANNIIPACNSCNSKKQDKDFEEWYPKQEFYNKIKAEVLLEYLGK